MSEYKFLVLKTSKEANIYLYIYVYIYIYIHIYKKYKKAKETKQKNIRLQFMKKKHTWKTSCKLLKGPEFVVEQTNFRIKHGLVTYSMLV